MTSSPRLLVLLVLLGTAAPMRTIRAQTRGDGIDQRPMPAQLRAILDSVRVAFNLRAVAGAIVTRDSVLASDVVGVRRLGGSLAATRTDLFHVGSDFKSMTAGWIALQVDAGRIGWGTTISDVFPELTSVMRTEYRPVTLLELLSHQSGFRPIRPPGHADQRGP